MRKLNICVIDLVAKAPTKRYSGRVMNANYVSIMPQIVALWCEQEGHNVDYIVYTGTQLETLLEEIPAKPDLAFIGGFTQAGQLSYALSNFLRSRGAVTALGGPHARCYPQDAQKYFDYVLGFTEKSTVQDVLQDCARHRPLGLYLSAPQQPSELPGVRERWKYISKALEKAPLIKIVAMMGSVGCPYTCSFCIDATIPYQQLSFEQMKEDLRFLLKQFKRPIVGWHDPNFGVRFNDYMDAIEEAVPPDSIDFIAESSLALLSEPHVKRLRKNGFKAILPGIESWYDMGDKSKTGKTQGLEKVQKVSEHVNTILRYIPYLQANFVFGLDNEEGSEPFELTKRFIELTPGAFPGYSLLTSFGQAAPLNIGYQRQNRVVPFPFHFMNNNHVMNVKPKNYTLPEFFRNLIDVTSHSFSWRMIARRFGAVSGTIPRWMNVLRAVSSEGFGRIKYHSNLLHMLETDSVIRDFWEGESSEIPDFYVDWIKRDLGPLWSWLPEGALYHDPNALLKAESAAPAEIEA